MAAASPREVTELLRAWSAGNEGALDKLLPLVYEELRQRAHRQLRGERPGHTLQTSALVNEVYVKLVGAAPVDWESRNHFLAISARMMRRILVDHARSRRSLKRGGSAPPVPIDEQLLAADRRPRDLVSLDEALQALSERDERMGRVVELRYFGGLSVEETAGILRVSPQTVKRDWRTAKAWLLRQMRREA
jgi:RNA polymerase sigma factor (TIGR02999 family)